MCCVLKGNPSDGPENEHLTSSPVGSRKERLLPSSHKACHKQLASPPCQGTKSIAIRRLQPTRRGCFPWLQFPLDRLIKDQALLLKISMKDLFLGFRASFL